MTIEPLTLDEYETLIEALEAWENKDAASEFVGDAVAAIVADRNDPQWQSRFESERTERRREMESAKRLRKERSVLVRAKLIRLRDSLAAQDFTSDALKDHS